MEKEHLNNLIDPVLLTQLDKDKKMVESRFVQTRRQS